MSRNGIPEKNGEHSVYTDAVVNDSTYTLKPSLQRQMKNRHIAMIRYVALYASDLKDIDIRTQTWVLLIVLEACGFLLAPHFERQSLLPSLLGVIGTGLFLGTAAGLQTGGPVGLLLAYALVC